MLINVVISKVLILSWNKDLETDMKTQEYVFNESPIWRLGIVACFYGFCG